MFRRRQHLVSVIPPHKAPFKGGDSGGPRALLSQCSPGTTDAGCFSSEAKQRGRGGAVSPRNLMGGACLTIWESRPDRPQTVGESSKGGGWAEAETDHSKSLPWPPSSPLLRLYKTQRISENTDILQLDVSTTGRRHHTKIALSRWENKSLVL